ncbi:uncharacterized protein LOC123526222 [Mercenaria mercenaria]|uniref:uncharacterized protein LOC123526222 n=1 Tax=Mercenaria mercenaria TaxID=6596 RepID=UPI00234E7B53|nr:uncharacterized protein LOC123526222 [Mercenaria mercenaria]
MSGRYKEEMMLYRLFVLCALFQAASCDYKCVCSYIVERGVYSTPSNGSDVLGYMYEFDCKPVVTETGSWFTVAFEHKLGYVEDGERLEVQTCPGDYPDADKGECSDESLVIK